MRPRCRPIHLPVAYVSVDGHTIGAVSVIVLALHELSAHRCFTEGLIRLDIRTSRPIHVAHLVVMLRDLRIGRTFKSELLWSDIISLCRRLALASIQSIMQCCIKYFLKVFQIIGLQITFSNSISNTFLNYIGK